MSRFSTLWSRTLRPGALDRAAILLSALCILHCVAGALMLVVLASTATATPWLDPAVHEAGLIVAIALAAISLGPTLFQRARRGTGLVGVAGLALMTLGLFQRTVAIELALTITGVALVALAHASNRNAAAAA